MCFEIEIHGLPTVKAKGDFIKEVGTDSELKDSDKNNDKRRRTKARAEGKGTLTATKNKTQRW
jgi:hypothetical protein